MLSEDKRKRISVALHEAADAILTVRDPITLIELSGALNMLGVMICASVGEKNGPPDESLGGNFKNSGPDKKSDAGDSGTA